MFIKVGCATRSLYASSSPKAERVPTNNQRGRGSGPCRLWGGLDKARHIVPTALLVRVQRFRNDLYKAVKGRVQNLQSSRWSLGNTDDVEGVSLFKSPTRWNSLRLWPSEVCRQDHHRRQGEWCHVIHNPETKLHQIWSVALWEFPIKFPKLVVSVTLCQKFWSDFLKILERKFTVLYSMIFDCCESGCYMIR